MLTELCDESATWHTPGKSVSADDDGHALGPYHCAGQRDHKQLDVDCCMVVEIKHGKIIDGRQYFFDLYAWDQFWA